MLAHPRSLALLLSVGVLTGCTVGPDYRRPEIALSPTFIGQEGVDHRQVKHKADLTIWWAAFDDPLLTHFVALALDQNLDIAQAAARVAQSRASLRYADAALLPAANVSITAARGYQSVETPLGQVLNATPGFDRSGSSYEANLNASWEIDMFGGLRRGREAARAAYEASEAGAVATRLAVAAQTADVYVTIRGLQARIAIARQQVETRRQLFAMVRLQYGKGVAAELQMNQAEGSLTQAEAQIPVLEAGLDSAMNALDVLLGVQPGTYRTELASVAPVPVVPGLAETGTPAELIRRRPDLIAAERRLAAANARIGVVVSEYYPKLSLAALLGSATAIASGNLFTGAASQAQGVLGLRWRLFDFGRVDAQIAAARGQEAEALAAYRLAVLRATEDVENAIEALVKREAQVGILTRGESSLARARENSLAAYKGGVVSLIEVLDADGKLLEARDAKAQAETEAARAAIASFRALGGGWDAQHASSNRLSSNLSTNDRR
ncbi:efflux transporter outer membrane subunit [Pseudogulbenkiania ferrooxidans]|uniref:RND efflux system, outer membrane lipoprotein, NodT family n=1 Tax=Pseudogulbenkiania ferrooxidans 2002 TaxID=279714 RepID=B9Z4C4_9NEIS|nr:efflux transporter outer membrane subunit [Pseudogulbenkiania ferrooxidans]EEG08701.1 RND efflux system, outer membrane lipoprotein, NodT family [Pseudogulbenkiania ferrooxidans 2002]